MAEIILKTGTTTGISVTVGKDGEIVLDSQKKTVVVFDGTKSGGYEMMSTSGVQTVDGAKTFSASTTFNTSAVFNASVNFTSSVVFSGTVDAQKDITVGTTGRVYFDGGIGTYIQGTTTTISIVPGATTSVIIYKKASGIYVMEVTNNVISSTAHGVQVTAGDNGAGTSAYFMIFLRPDGSTCGSITKNGSTATAFNTSSDRRIKKNIERTKASISDVMKINVWDFNFSADPDGLPKQTGLIAQELNDVFPTAVSRPDEGTWGIDYGRLTPLLIKALQEVYKEVLEIKSKHKKKERKKK